MPLVEIIKARDRREIPKAFRRKIDVRARPMAKVLQRFLLRLARREVARARRDGRLSEKALATIRKRTKATPIVKMELIQKATNQDVLELAEILRTFGLRRMNAAGKKTATSFDSEWVERPTAEKEFLESKEIRVKEFLDETNKQFPEDLRDVLLEASQETPQPSIGALTRRLFQRVTTETGPMSPERAQLIARTETSQSENTGIMEGYVAAGVTEIEWVHAGIARTTARIQHVLMDGKKTKVGVPFKLPDGTLMMHPGDPNAPVKHLANCRCSTIPTKRSLRQALRRAS